MEVVSDCLLDSGKQSFFTIVMIRFHCQILFMNLMKNIYVMKTEFVFFLLTVSQKLENLRKNKLFNNKILKYYTADWKWRKEMTCLNFFEIAQYFEFFMKHL